MDAKTEAKGGDDSADAALDIVRALVEGSLPPYLDDAVLGKMDPEDWAVHDDYAACAGKNAGVRANGFVGAGFTPVEGGGGGGGVGSAAELMEDKENHLAARNRGANRAARTKVVAEQTTQPEADTFDVARKAALADILLAEEAGLGANSTIVNEIPELRLSARSRPSAANVARLILTNAMQASLVHLKTAYAAPAAPTLSPDRKGQGTGEAEKTLRAKAIALVSAVYATECAQDASFAEAIVDAAESEHRLEELVNSLHDDGHSKLSKPTAQIAVRDAGPMPSSAFSYMAMMEMQMCTLEYSFASASPGDKRVLIETTCDHLMKLFTKMPLGALAAMAPWEHQMFDALAQKFIDLGARADKATDHNVGNSSSRDIVDLFLLALSIQRSFLDGVIATLQRIMSRDERSVEPFDADLNYLLKRLGEARLYCPISNPGAPRGVLPRWLQLDSENARYAIHVRWPSFDAGCPAPFDTSGPTGVADDDLFDDLDRETKAGDPWGGDASGRPSIGDLVRLSPRAEPNKALRRGEVGRICVDDGSSTPFRVCGPRGDIGIWFAAENLVRVADLGASDADASAWGAHENPRQTIHPPSIAEEDDALRGARHPRRAFFGNRSSADGLSVSRDGRFFYICGESVKGIARVGSGCAGLGSTATVAGHVYAHYPMDWARMGKRNQQAASQLGWITELADGNLLVLLRRRGSAWVEAQCLRAETLTPVLPNPYSALRFRLTDVKEVLREQVVGVRQSEHLVTRAYTAKDASDVVRIELEGIQSAASAAAAWVGSGSSWVAGRGCWYFEVTVRRAGSIAVGWATPAFFNDRAEDNVSAAWTMQVGNATVTDEHGVTRSWGQICREGDVIGCTLDSSDSASDGKVRIMFSKNGSSLFPMGTAFVVDGPVLYARPLIVLERAANPNPDAHDASRGPCVDLCVGSLKESVSEAPLGRGRLRYRPAGKDAWHPVAWSAGASLSDDRLGDEDPNGMLDDEDDEDDLDVYEEEDADTTGPSESRSGASSPERGRSRRTAEEKQDTDTEPSPTLRRAGPAASRSVSSAHPGIPSGLGGAGAFSSSLSWPEHAGVLPPLTTDGRLIYCVERAPPLLPKPHGRSALEQPQDALVVRALDPAQGMAVIKIWRLGALSEIVNFPKVDRLASWQVFTNGDDLVVMDSFQIPASTESGKAADRAQRCGLLPLALMPSVGPHHAEVAAVAESWLRDGWPGLEHARPRALEQQLIKHGQRDAYSFSQAHGLVWTWDGTHNTCRAYDIDGLASFDRSSWRALEVSDQPSRREICVQALSAIARLGASFAGQALRRGIFEATLEDLRKSSQPTRAREDIADDSNSLSGQMASASTFSMDPHGPALSQLLEIMEGMMRGVGAVSELDPVDTTGVRACLRLIAAHCASRGVSSKAVGPELAKKILDASLLLVKGDTCVSKDEAGVQDLAADVFAHALSTILPTLSSRATFLQQELASVSAQTLRVKPALSRVLCVVVQSLTAGLLALPFERQLAESASVLPRILSVAEKVSFEHLETLRIAAASTRPSSPQRGLESDPLSHLCDAGCGLLVSILSSGLCDASTALLPSSLVQIVDIFSVVLEKCSAILSTACETASSLQTDAAGELPAADGGSANTGLNALSKIVQHSLVGRVFPIVCGWLEFLCRSATTRAATASALLSVDQLLGSLTAFVGLIVQFSAVLASEGAPGVPATGPPSTSHRKLSRSDMRRRGSTIVTAAAIAAEHASAANEKPWVYAWSRTFSTELEYESPHDYENDTNDRWVIEVPGAASLTVIFDPRTATEERRDYLRFLKIPADGGPEDSFQGSGIEKCPSEQRYGKEQYSGLEGWPGVNGTPPLVIPANRCVVTFNSDGSDVDWGYKFRVIAEVTEVRRVVVRPWIDHLAGMAQDLVAAVINGMVGSNVLLSDVEMRNLRWVQNPILSGGLSETATSLNNTAALTPANSGLAGPALISSGASNSSHPSPSARKSELPPVAPRKLGPEGISRSLSSKQIESKQAGAGGDGTSNGSEAAPNTGTELWKRRGASGRPNAQGPTLSGAGGSNPKLSLRPRGRTQSSSRLRLYSMSEDDRTRATTMLLEMIGPEFPPENLGGALFQCLRSQRVPLDQGFFTHRAAASLGAALIRVNGLEREALRLAKANLNAQQGAGEPPSARLLKVWSVAQYIRRWADQLVVNGQVLHHVEASLPEGSPLRKKLLDKIATASECEDAEEPLYEALCEIVSERAQFLILDVAPPTSRVFSLRSARKDAARARWHRLRRHFCPKTQRMLQEKKRWHVLIGALRALSSLRSLVDRHRSAAQKMAIPLTRTRSSTLTRPSSHESDLGRERAGSRERSFSRDAVDPSMSEDGLGPGRVPHLRLNRAGSTTHYASVDSPMNTPPHLLSARSASSTTSNTSAKSSHFNFQAPVRRRERLSGGIRRGSIAEADGDVDMLVQEHDQSLSESVHTFLQAAVPIDGETLRTVLSSRNERALMRTAGFDFINNVTALARTELRHKEGRRLFDTVLASTARALRGIGNTHHLDVKSGRRILAASRSDAKDDVAVIATEAALLAASAYPGVAGAGGPSPASEAEGDAAESASAISPGSVASASQDPEVEPTAELSPLAAATAGPAESHFMTDLAGCSLSLREGVSRSFLSFLRSINALMQLALRQQSSVAQVLRGEQKIEDEAGLTPWHRRNLQILLTQIMGQLQQYLHVISLDFVESDFDLLAESDVVSGLRAVLFHDFKSTYDVELVRSIAGKCFELLLRRCVCETGQGSEETLRFTSGNSLQQSLLDVLVALLESSMAKTSRKAVLPQVKDLPQAADEAGPGANEVLGNTVTAGDAAGEVTYVLGPEEASFVAGPVVLETRASTIKFRLCVARARAGEFRAGRLFSIGNPQVEVDAIGVSTSHYIAGPPGSADEANDLGAARFSYLEVGVDPQRRLVVSVGDLAGIDVSLLSEFAIPEDVECEVGVILREHNLVELHLVSTEPFQAGSLGPAQSHVSSQGDSCIYTVEVFEEALSEVGKLPIDLRQERLLVPDLRAGDYVRVLRGSFAGFVGFVLGVKHQMACVCIDFRRLHHEDADDSDIQLFPIALAVSTLVQVPCEARSLHRGPTASAQQAILASGGDKSALEADKLAARILPGLGLSEEEVEEGLTILDHGAGSAARVRTDSSSRIALKAPLYIGGCPDWGMGPQRKTAQGVIVHGLSFDSSGLAIPDKAQGVAPTSTTNVPVASPSLPSESTGGVVLSFPLALLLDWDDEDATEADGDEGDATEDSNAGGGGAFNKIIAGLRFVEGRDEPIADAALNEQVTVRALEVLSLAYAACASPVGRARLTAPYALTLLLRTCITGASTLSLRIASGRVLAALLIEVPPTTASNYAAPLAKEFGVVLKKQDGPEGNVLVALLMRCIGGALHLAGGRGGLQRNGFEARAMAMQLVELVHELCAADAWAQTVAAWITGALDRYADHQAEVHGVELVEVMGALAALGGVFESPRTGGRAVAASKSGLLSRNEVVVLGKVPQTAGAAVPALPRTQPRRRSKRPVDITSRMKVQVSTGHPAGSVGNAQYLLDGSPNYWESNGYTPHWIQMVCPSGFTFYTISIFTNEVFENYSPEKIEIRLGPTPESLRTVRIVKLQLVTRWVDLVQEADVRKSDRVFRLEITSNHAGGCDSRIQQVRVLARHHVDENDSTLESLDQQFHVRPIYGNEVPGAADELGAEIKQEDTSNDRASATAAGGGTASTAGGGGARFGASSIGATASDAHSIYVETLGNLEPIPLSPPATLLGAFRGDLVHALQRMLSGAPLGLVHADVRARTAKAVSILLENQALVEQLGEALMPQLLQEARSRNRVSVMAREPVRWALSDLVAQRLRLYPEEPDVREGSASITFAAAGKQHRAVALDMSPMVSGKHAWEVRLDQDVKDDETAMFGVTALAHLGSEFGQRGTGSAVENLLKPSGDFWLVQAYNGNRIHEGVSTQWEGAGDVRVHPGDVVRFLLDMDMGTLSVAVNDKPLTRVFYGIDKRATWGVYPCVAAYGNRSDVQMTLLSLRTTSPGSGSGQSAVPQRHIFRHGADAHLEVRAARVAELFFEGVADAHAVDGVTPARSPVAAAGFMHDDEACEQEAVLDVTDICADGSRDLEDMDKTEDEDDSSRRERSASTRDALNGSGGLVSSGLSASQQMIQKINVLYEVVDSSAEEDVSQPSPLSLDSARRDQEVQTLAMAILSDPRFISSGTWLGAVGKDIFECLYDRYCRRALEKLVVDWSLCTSRPLPQYLLQGASLQRTINLVYRSSVGGGGGVYGSSGAKPGGGNLGGNASDGNDARAVDAITSWATGSDETRVKQSLLDACTKVFIAVGRQLSLGVQAHRERMKEEKQAREAEERDAVTALAQVREAREAQRALASNTRGPTASNGAGSQQTTGGSDRRGSTATSSSSGVGSSSRAGPPSVRGSALRVGDLVRARYKGGRNYYSGVIMAAFTDGTYNIDYDDGDKETHVPRSRIVPLATAEESGRLGRAPGAPFELGDRVQGRFRRGVRWYQGRIARVYEGGQYDVLYDDGDFDRRLEGSYVRGLNTSEDQRTGAWAGGPAASDEQSAANQQQEEPTVPSAPPTPPADASLDEHPGQYVLIADRYRGDIPQSGKPDSAQVSIVNSPATTDGYIRTIKLRLAEPPAGGMDSWDVLVFERAGDTSTFFVVAGTTAQPTCGTIRFDPHTTEIQTVPVEGTVFISQGQYLGVINRRGRLNVAYTPGKKKIEESWALKPVEVFYLMPKSVPDPFEGGPHRTRLWHGRAGWCATMQVANASTHEGKSRYLRESAEDVFSMKTESGMRVQESVRQACWLLTVLLREKVIPAMQVLESPFFLHAVRRVCDHGIFCIDGDSGKLDEISSPIYGAWLPVVDMISLLCACAVDVTGAGFSGRALPRPKAEALVLLQAVLETKVNEMNEHRQRRLRDLVKTKALLTSSNAADASAGASASSPAMAQAGPPTATPTRVHAEAISANVGGQGDNGEAGADSHSLSWRPRPRGSDGPRSYMRGGPETADGGGPAYSTPTAARTSLLVSSANYRASATSRARMAEAFAPASPEASAFAPSPPPLDAGTAADNIGANNADESADKTGVKVADGLLRLEQDEKGTVAGIRFQRLLKCLVSVDDLARKDGLDGESLVIDSPRRALKEDASWEDYTVRVKAQPLLTAPVLSFEHFDGRLCVSSVREVGAASAPGSGGSEAGVHENLQTLGKEVAVGDELIAVEGHFLESLDPKTRAELTAIGMAGPVCAAAQSSSTSGVAAAAASTSPPSVNWAEASIPDFSEPYTYNGVRFPPLQPRAEALLSPSGASAQSEKRGSADGLVATISSMDEIRLTFRRRRGEFTLSQKRQLGKGISYHGVRESIEAIASETSEAAAAAAAGTKVSLDSADWLDSLVTATELLKAFACQTLPPSRFLKDQFVRWCQHVKGGSLESLHPVFREAKGFFHSPPLVMDGRLDHDLHARGAADQGRRLFRQRTHSRVSEDDLASMDGSETRSVSLRGDVGALPRSGMASSTSSLSNLAAASAALGRADETLAGTMPGSRLAVPGATALMLEWDPRTCLHLGKGSASIVVHVNGREFRGANGLPPNLSMVSGSALAVTVDAQSGSLVSQSAKRHNNSTSSLTSAASMASALRKDASVAALRNRAGAYVWLGTQQHFRAKFYCGRPSSEIVGWSSTRGSCGPHGGSQCPDCAIFMARNMEGLPMVSGTSRELQDRRRFKDILYCDRCLKPPVPCVDCRRFLAAMARTHRLTDIPWRERASFASDEAYAEFLSCIIVPGMPMRIAQTAPRLPSSVRPGSLVEVQAVRETGRALVIAQGRSLSSYKQTLELPLEELELVSVLEVGGQDLRALGRAGATSMEMAHAGGVARRNRSLLSPELLSAHSFAPRQGRISRSDTMDDDDLDDIDDDIDELLASGEGEASARGSGRRSGHTTFLEASDFLSSNEYAQYMARNCNVHDKVRCSKRYESVGEGDVGEVIRIDEGDDLPCQVMWETLGTQYWLPWDCLSLNLRPPSRRRGAISGRGGAGPGAAQSEVGLRASGSGSGRSSSKRSNRSRGGAGVPDAPGDDTSVTFAAQATPGVELYNNNRSITKAMRSSGWVTKRLNTTTDASSGCMNVCFRIDDVSRAKLIFGVIALEGFGGEHNELEGATPMVEAGAWGLTRRGELFANGVCVRGKAMSKTLHAGDLITVSLDPVNCMVTFIRNEEVLDTICGLPSRVVAAVSLGSSAQRVSIERVEVGEDVQLTPIEGWGYKLKVTPTFDPSSIQIGNGDDADAGYEGAGAGAMDRQYREYIARQQKWTRRQDEALVAFANAAVANSRMDLAQLLDIAWEELYAIAPLNVREIGPGAGGPEGDGDDLPSVAETASVDAAEGVSPLDDEAWPAPATPVAPLVRRGARLSLTDTRATLDRSALRQQALSSALATAGVAQKHHRKKKSTGRDKSPVSTDLLSLVRERASVLGDLRARTAEASEDDGAPRGDLVHVGDGLRLERSLLRDTLLDIAQRFDLVRSLNKAVHEALGLLDLSAWRDATSTAAHLSECCGLLFDKFKVPLWVDAVSSTKAEDIHKFDVILDFGKAMSKRHLADVHGRHTVYAQAFRVMHPMPAKTLRAHGKLYKCVMRGMASHDDGGPYRQSFSEYCKELQTLPGVGLLLPCSNRANEIRVNRDRWLPNPAATSPVQISMFEFLGKLMGIAIRNRELLDLRLPSLVWKPLVNQAPTVDDLRAVDVLTVSNTDPAYPDPAALLEQQPMFYTVITLDGREVELVPNGRLLQVTPQNYADWAQRSLEYKVHEFDVQVEAIRRGLATIVPQRLLMLFRWEELELMVCGRPRIDIDLLKRMTVYSDCSESDAHIQAFWEVLEEFSDEQRSDYLKFVWGRARLPLDRESWDQPHKISSFHPPRAAYGRPETTADDMLPYAHTCYFSLDLPAYSSKEVMRRKLLYAVQCTEIDGDQTTTGRMSMRLGFEIDDDDDDDDAAEDSFGHDVYDDVEDAAAGSGAGPLPPSPPPPPPPGLGDAQADGMAAESTEPAGSGAAQFRPLPLDTIAENISGAGRRFHNLAGMRAGLGADGRLDHAAGLTVQHLQQRRESLARASAEHPARPFSLTQLIAGTTDMDDDPFGEYIDPEGDIQRVDSSSNLRR